MKSERDRGVLALVVMLTACIVVTAQKNKMGEQGTNYERSGRTLDPGGIVTKFHDGLNMAGNFLGLDTSRGVANLVSKSLLAVKPTTWLRSKDPPALFTGFFRLLGFDATKLGAIALNALIFVAQMISTSLARTEPAVHDDVTEEKTQPAVHDDVTEEKTQPAGHNDVNEEKTQPAEHNDDVDEKEAPPEGSPLSWIMDNTSSQLSALLGQAHARSLPDHVIAAIKSRTNSSSSSVCVQLLVCKIAPFIWGMQRGLTAMVEDSDGEKWRMMRPIQKMYAHLPEMREFRENGDVCMKRFPECYG